MGTQPRRRRSLRWRGFDYAATRSYGVTICVQGRACILGSVRGAEVVHSAAGSMVIEAWREIPRAFRFVRVDAHVIMPNHVHGVLRFRRDDGWMGRCSHDLGAVIRWWKCATTARYQQGVRRRGWPAHPGRLWQRSFYDRVLRDDDELEHARRYIRDNPGAWDRDPNNPERR